MTNIPRAPNVERDYAEVGQERPLELRDLLSILQRRRGVLLLVFALVAGLALGVGLLLPPTYTATATVMVNPANGRVVNPDQALTDDSPSVAVVDSEVEVLRSRRLAAQVMRALNLDHDPAWYGAAFPWGVVQQVERAAGLPVDDGAEARQQHAITALQQAVAIQRRGDSYVVDVNAKSRRPQQAADIANRWVRLYVGLDTEARLDTGARASDWLLQRLAELRTDVEQKESAAQAFRAQSGLLTAGGASLTEQQVSDMQAAMMSARSDLAEKEARMGLIERLTSGAQPDETLDTLTDALDSQTIRDLRAREVDLTRNQAQLESTLGPQHPAVRANAAELDDVRTQIHAELARIQAGVRNEVEIARTRLASLEGNSNTLRAQLASSNTALGRVNQLDADAAAARSVYESFMQRYHVIADQGRLAGNNVRIVNDAETPRVPSSPKMLLIVLVAIVGGFGAGIAAAFLVEYFDDTLSSVDQLEQRVGVAAVASIPFVTKSALRLTPPSDRQPAGYAVEKPMSAYAEAFRVLRTTIEYSNMDRTNRAIAVASALPSEGKTTCAYTLARICALGGESVILVDCDLRHRSLNVLLDIEPRFGLLQVLSGAKPWREAIGRDEQSGAHVLPLAADAFTPRNVFKSEAMWRLVEELKEAYDLVILDCPPILVAADARVLASLADGALIVARSKRTPARAMRSALRQLAMVNANILGVALNCVDRRSPGRVSYSDGLYYGRVYGGYYAD